MLLLLVVQWCSKRYQEGDGQKFFEANWYSNWEFVENWEIDNTNRFRFTAGQLFHSYIYFRYSIMCVDVKCQLKPWNWIVRLSFLFFAPFIKLVRLVLELPFCWSTITLMTGIGSRIRERLIVHSTVIGSEIQERLIVHFMWNVTTLLWWDDGWVVTFFTLDHVFKVDQPYFQKK